MLRRTVFPALLLLVAAAGNSEPARPGAEPPVRVGEPVLFTDLSSGRPTSWAWDFEYDVFHPDVDSTEQNPTWTFTRPGLWAVRLEVCNPMGCSVQIRYVEVRRAEPTPLADSSRERPHSKP